MSYVGGSVPLELPTAAAATWGAWCQVMECLRAAYNNEQQAVEFLGSN